MGDNQIVTAVVQDIANMQRGVGKRYIVMKNGKYVIAEDNGTEWIYIEQIDKQNTPAYIFVSDVNRPVILYDGKIWTEKKWFICSECKKVTVNRMKCEGKEQCIHCFFKINHDNPNRKEYDGHPMTIGRYIKKYANYHNVETCNHTDKCFLCDFKKNKLLLGINDSDIIYHGKMVDILQTKTIDINV